MNISEKVYLTFSIKNCKLNDFYQIKIISDIYTFNMENSFETEKLKCQEEGMDLQFRKILDLNYRFNITQKIQIIIRREVYKDENKNYVPIEEIRNTSLSSMVTSPNSVYERPLKLSENHSKLSIELNGNPDNKKNSLFNSFKEGLKLSCFFSMDFSQGLNKQSIKDSKTNYLNIIKSILGIIFHYVKDNYCIYGYGAILKDQKNSNSIDKNIFNMNTNENEKINHENIFDKIIKFPYTNIIPKKKVIFSNMLKEIKNDIFKIYKEKYYNLLFIFEREIIEDNNIQETKSILDEMEKLPISIVVICEGQNDFSKMNKIKNYSNKLKFIECKNVFNKNTEKEVEYSLGEIAKEIIDYNKSIIFKNISKINNSFQESYAYYKSIILSQKENEEENEEKNEEENKEENKEDEEKIISKFYNFQKIHEEYKKKKNNQNNGTEININKINQNNQSYQSNQSIKNSQSIKNNQNNGIYRIQVSNNSNQNKNNNYFDKPIQNGTDLSGQYKYLTPSYNTNYNTNSNIINPYNNSSGSKENSSQIISNPCKDMNMQNENNNRKTYQDDDNFCLFK